MMYSKFFDLRRKFIKEQKPIHSQIWFHEYYWGLRLNHRGFDLFRDKMVYIEPFLANTLEIENISIVWYYDNAFGKILVNESRIYLLDKEAAMWLQLLGPENIKTWSKNYMI